MNTPLNRCTALSLFCRHLTVALIFITSSYPITTQAEASSNVPPVKIFDLKSDATFSNYKKLINNLAQRRGANRAANNFCVVGFINDDQTRSVWIVWSEGQKIYLWEGEDQPLDKMRGTIDLKKDVVNTEKDLHGSTYLVTKAWVNNLTETCQRIGEKIHIKKIMKPHKFM